MKHERNFYMILWHDIWKTGVVEPEETTIARQQLGKHGPATTNKPQ
jgi:hypothetical protein